MLNAIQECFNEIVLNWQHFWFKWTNLIRHQGIHSWKPTRTWTFTFMRINQKGTRGPYCNRPEDNEAPSKIWLTLTDPNRESISSSIKQLWSKIVTIVVPVCFMHSNTDGKMMTYLTRCFSTEPCFSTTNVEYSLNIRTRTLPYKNSNNLTK